MAGGTQPVLSQAVQHDALSAIFAPLTLASYTNGEKRMAYSSRPMREERAVGVQLDLFDGERSRSPSPLEAEVEGVTYFEVEDMVYRVSQCRLREESLIFRSMYDLSRCCQTSANAEGSSRAHPIVLHGVSGRDFERLLQALNPSSYAYTLHATKPGSLEELESVLRLSTMWCFPNLRKATIDLMTQIMHEQSSIPSSDVSLDVDIPPLDPVDKILLADRYNISSWFISGLDALVQRPHILTAEETERLGWVWAYRVFVERERCRELRHRANWRNPGACYPDDRPCTHSHAEELRVVFKAELEDMDREEVEVEEMDGESS